MSDDTPDWWPTKEEMKAWRAKQGFKNYHKGPTDKTEFHLSDADAKLVYDWLDKHSETCEKVYGYAGAVGGGSVFIFSPTSIGDFTTFRCRCGEEYNFTDYSSL
jgi:hypothetical protein